MNAWYWTWRRYAAAVAAYWLVLALMLGGLLWWSGSGVQPVDPAAGGEAVLALTRQVNPVGTTLWFLMPPLVFGLLLLLSRRQAATDTRVHGQRGPAPNGSS